MRWSCGLPPLPARHRCYAQSDFEMSTNPSVALSSPSQRLGFTLVEVVMSLGIFAFVGVALIGLFVVGVNTNHESVEELEATTLIQSWLAARRAAPTADIDDRCPLPPLNVTGPEVPKSPLLINKLGQTVSSANQARFGLLYRITPPSPGSNATRVHVLLFWPPGAKPEQAAGYQEMSTVFLLQ